MKALFFVLFSVAQVYLNYVQLLSTAHVPISGFFSPFFAVCSANEYKSLHINFNQTEEMKSQSNRGISAAMQEECRYFAVKMRRDRAQ